MKIYPGSIVCYDQRPGYHRRKKLFGGTFKAARTDNEKYTGLMSSTATRNLRNAINLLVAQADWKLVQNETTGNLYEFKVNFVTLTLSGPQYEITDKEIKKHMLAPWLRRMKKTCGLKSYVWRAERQKNGRLHFHITSDCYMHYATIRDEWNRQQEKFHFIDYYRRENDGTWPNSTDVHSVRDVDNLAAYISKYMSKKEKDAQEVEGRLWDCSPNLKVKDYPVFEVGSQELELLEKLSKKYRSYSPEGAYCYLISIPEIDMKRELAGKWYDEYRQFLDKVRFSS